MVPNKRERKRKMKKKILKILKYIFYIFILLGILILSLNIFVKWTTKSKILEREEIASIEQIDAIVVLGAGVRGKNPSPMLEDRLLEAISLYEDGVSPKIIMSGDHGTKYYDEVNVMKNFAMEKGVPSENIFMDHAGFSSYDSIYRAKEIFGVKKIVLVTQKYHLYRALYIAKQLGIEAYGVSADPRTYVGQTKREIREILARNKDFFKCILKPESARLGDTIPINGSGDVTNG